MKDAELEKLVTAAIHLASKGNALALPQEQPDPKIIGPVAAAILGAALSANNKSGVRQALLKYRL